MGAGLTGEALAFLDRLLDRGQDPILFLAALSYRMRQLAQVNRLSAQGVGLDDAFSRVGVPPFARRDCEQQMRHLGRRRLDRSYDMLLEADLGMKGGSQLPPRVILERLVVRLARAKG
jgi:DNA polymerase-3 subunit delta